MSKTLVFITTFLISLIVGSGLVLAYPSHNQVVVHYVNLQNNTAYPSVVAVKVGEGVEFDAKDSRPHIIAQGDGNENGLVHNHAVGGLESPTFTSTQGYSVHFKQTGTYTFHDHLNPDIFVTVIVYSPKS